MGVGGAAKHKCQLSRRTIRRNNLRLLFYPGLWRVGLLLRLKVGAYGGLIAKVRNVSFTNSVGMAHIKHKYFFCITLKIIAFLTRN